MWLLNDIKKWFLWLFLPAIALFSSCGEEREVLDDGSGYIEPTFTIGNTLTVFGTQAAETVELTTYIPSFLITLETADGSQSHTWNGLDAFPSDQLYIPGRYVLTARLGNIFSEGLGSPYMSGSEAFDLQDGSTARPDVEVGMESVGIRWVNDGSAGKYFKEYSLICHSQGGSYVEITLDEANQTAYLRPGDIDLMARLNLDDGRSAVVDLFTIANARVGFLYEIAFSAHRDSNGSVEIEVSYDPTGESDDRVVTLDESCFVANGAILCEGFQSGVTYSLVEGTAPSSGLTMTLAENNLKGLMMSVNWECREENILNGLGSLADLGIMMGKGENIVLDFTEMARRLRRTPANNRFTVSVQAEYSDGTLSVPASLEIELTSAEIEIVEVGTVMSGLNKGNIVVTMGEEASSNLSVELLGDDGQWATAPDIEIETVDKMTFLTFGVPLSEKSTVYARILYCGEVKQTVEMRREWPKYTISVDAFARKAMVRFEPEERSLTRFVAENATIYADDKPLTVLSSELDAGLILVTGLEPNTSYTLKTALVTNPTSKDFSSPVRVTTEKAESLVNGDFEDVKQSIKYSDLPSGGRYSQNISAIFNEQNHTSFDVYFPTGWTSVNSKTFCMRATNPNTWYMQPSAETVDDYSYDGTRSVKITNVAWDVTGEEIPDYLQEGLPYTRYSKNVPNIKYRAVGKLFLGSYSFDPTTMSESYNEGVSFNSRPSSLNGFYRFLPANTSNDQHGYVRVEILGMVDNSEEIIAEGEIFLSPATGFTAFSVPLSYSLFGVKARKAKVMFAASPLTGSIDYETEQIVTISDPVTSTSKGNTLWVDGVDFSY